MEAYVGVVFLGVIALVIGVNISDDKSGGCIGIVLAVAGLAAILYGIVNILKIV